MIGRQSRLSCFTLSRNPMQAIRIHQFGLPEVMVLEEVPDPVPAAGQVVIRVRAAGANPLDAHLRSGMKIGDYAPALPWTPSNDAAGIVETIGAGVTHLKVGDRVYAQPLKGSYAVIIGVRLSLIGEELNQSIHAALHEKLVRGTLKPVVDEEIPLAEPPARTTPWPRQGRWEKSASFPHSISYHAPSERRRTEKAACPDQAGMVRRHSCLLRSRQVRRAWLSGMPASFRRSISPRRSFITLNN
jgi:hypothetical protein